MNFLLIIGFLIMGWFAWSFTHYALHRWWHDLIIGYDDRKKTLADEFAYGEYRHHVIYDPDPYEPSHDPKKHFISFPRWVCTPGIVISTFLLAGFFLYFGHEMWAMETLAYFIGAYGAMNFDDFIHRSFQHGNVRSSYFSHWIKGYHHAHHEGHDCNFAFFTGIPWDFLLRTYRKPVITRTARQG